MTAVGGCQECIAAGKSLQPMCAKGDIGKVYEPKVPNECILLDFWGHINYLNEKGKNVLISVDRFSRWPSVVFCNNNKSDKVLKVLRNFISHHGVPRNFTWTKGLVIRQRQ